MTSSPAAVGVGAADVAVVLHRFLHVVLCIGHSLRFAFLGADVADDLINLIRVMVRRERRREEE